MLPSTKRILARIRRFFRSVRQLMFFGIFVLVAMGAYMHFHGLPSSWKNTVLDELGRRGIHLQIESLHFDLLRGVVARGVHYDSVTDDSVRLQVAELALNVNIMDLLRRHMMLNHVEVDGADIKIFPRGTRTPILIQHAGGRLRFPGAGILQLESVVGDVRGLRIELNGRLDLTPSNERVVSQKPAISPETIQAWLAKIGSVKTGEPVEIRIELDGVLARPESLKAVGRISGRRLSYEGWRADEITGKVSYANGVVSVPGLFVEANRGKFEFYGSWEKSSGRIDFEVLSSLDPNALFIRNSPAKPKFLMDLQFDVAPQIWVKGSLNTNERDLWPSLEGQGSFSFGEMFWEDNFIQSIRGNLSVSGGKVDLPNLSIAQKFGSMSGNFSYEIVPRAVTFDFVSSLDFAKIMRLLYPSEKNWFRTVKFRDPASLSMAGRWLVQDPKGLKAKGKIDWKQWSSNGVPMQYTRAKVDIDGRRFLFRDLELGREEGKVNGYLELDFGLQAATLDAVSTVHFSELTRFVSLKTEEMFSPYKFPVPPRVSMRGRIGLDNNDAQNDFDAHVDAPQFKIWRLSGSDVSADIHNYRKSIEIAQFQGGFYSGELSGDAVFDLSSPVSDWSFHCALDGVDFDRFTHDLWDYDQVEGLLTGWAEMSGTMKSSHELKGFGEARVSDGVLWKIPLFGELSKFIPLLGVQKATKAYGTFTVENEQVNVDDLKVSAGVMSLTAKGIYKFDQSVDFIVQGHFLRALFGIGYVFDPFTKAFEYHLGGKLNQRKWKPRFIPKELLFQFSNDEATEPSPSSP